MEHKMAEITSDKKLGSVELFIAAQTGNVGQIKSLIEAGINIYKPDENNNCALAIAFSNRHEEVIKELLNQYEKDLSLIEKNYSGLIYLAIDEDEINWVLNLDKSVNVGTHVKVYLKTSERNNEIKNIYISNKLQLNFLNELNKNGLLDVNARNLEGDTLLDLSVEFGNVEIVRKLLQLGARNIRRVPDYGNRGFHEAISKGLVKIVELYLMYFNLKKLNQKDRLLLIQSAARSGHADIFHLVFNLIVDLELKENTDKNKAVVVKNILKMKYDSYFLITVLHLLIESKCTDIAIDLINKYDPDLEIGTNLSTYGSSYLDYAIVANSLELVQLLLKKGMDVTKDYSIDCLDEEFFTNALIVGTQYGDYEIFQELVKRCPREILRSEEEDWTLKMLFKCISSGSTEKIKLLLDVGMDLKECFNGDTSVHVAAMSDELAMVQLVVNHLGSESTTHFLKAENSVRDKPINLATSFNIVEYLLKLGANPNSVGHLNRTPLTYAARYGKYDLVKLLLENGGDAELVNEKGDKPIQSTIKFGNYEIFKLFFSSETDIEMTNESGNSLLMLAAKSSSWEIFDDLVKAGADITVANHEGQTALHFAKDEKIINALVANGADLMALDKKGNTPYLTRVDSSNWETKEFRNHLQFDIDYSLINNNKVNILHSILCHPNGFLQTYPEIFTEEKFKKLFEYSGCNEWGYSTFMVACCVRDMPLEAVEKLFECGNPDLNLVDGQRFTAVHRLVKIRNVKVLRYVLEKGADLEIVCNDQGRTPIILAADNVEAVKLLIQYGADVNARDEKGLTALHLAVETESFESARWLVAAGADLNIKCHENKSPLDYDTDGYMRTFFTPFL